MKDIDMLFGTVKDESSSIQVKKNTIKKFQMNQSEASSTEAHSESSTWQQKEALRDINKLQG